MKKCREISGERMGELKYGAVIKIPSWLYKEKSLRTIKRVLLTCLSLKHSMLIFTFCRLGFTQATDRKG